MTATFEPSAGLPFLQNDGNAYDWSLRSVSILKKSVSSHLKRAVSSHILKSQCDVITIQY